MKGLIVLMLFTMYAVVLSSQAENDISKKNNLQKQQRKLNLNKMKSVLIIGMDPHSIDFTNPELPPGLTINIIEQGTKQTLEKLRSMGYDAEVFLIKTGTTDFSGLGEQLRNKKYGGVVIGNGIRGIKSNFILFEQLVNLVHAHAPDSKIIFNSLPTDTDVAVKRWL